MLSRYRPGRRSALASFVVHAGSATTTSTPRRAHWRSRARMNRRERKSESTSAKRFPYLFSHAFFTRKSKSSATTGTPRRAAITLRRRTTPCSPTLRRRRHRTRTHHRAGTEESGRRRPGGRSSRVQERRPRPRLPERTRAAIPRGRLEPHHVPHRPVAGHLGQERQALLGESARRQQDDAGRLRRPVPRPEPVPRHHRPQRRPRPREATKNGTVAVPVTDAEMEAIMALAGADPRTGTIPAH